MSISIATLGMFGSGDLDSSLPVEIKIKNPGISCNLSKPDIAVSIAKPKLNVEIKDTNVTIKLNKNKLKLIAREA